MKKTSNLRIEATHPPGEGSGAAPRHAASASRPRIPAAAAPAEQRAPAARVGFDARHHVDELRTSKGPRSAPPRRPFWQRMQDRIWREFPGAPPTMAAGLALAAVAFAALVGLAFVRAVAPPEPVDAGTTAAASAGQAAGWSAEPEGLAAILAPFDEERAFAALAAYLEADGWEAKLAHVRRPYEVGDLMARHYRDPGHRGEDAARRLGARIHAKAAPAGNREFIVLAARVAPEQASRLFFVEKVDDDLFKIDWESSVGHQVMPLEAFRQTLPTEPVPFRVQVRRGDYHNFLFEDPESWLALELSYPGQPDFHLHAYAERGTEVADRLDQLLPEGIEHRIGLIVNLAYPDDERARPEQARLTGIVADSWFPR